MKQVFTFALVNMVLIVQKYTVKRKSFANKTVAFKNIFTHFCVIKIKVVLNKDHLFLDA